MSVKLPYDPSKLDIQNKRIRDAAPELLEACEAALLRDDVADCELGEQIRQAIAKAKGEAC